MDNRDNVQHTDYENGNTVNNEPVNTELLEKVEIEDTPFTAVRFGDNWFLTMGKYRLTPPLQTLEQCKEAAMDASWWRIMQICNILIKEHEETKGKTTNASGTDGD